jgi:hypothetical protein
LLHAIRRALPPQDRVGPRQAATKDQEVGLECTDLHDAPSFSKSENALRILAENLEALIGQQRIALE